MLKITHASFATVDELLRFKERGFTLSPFPGDAPDEWGIKAHNRPWVADQGRWRAGQRVAEVGGAYSRLPEFLAETYGVEAWVIDDFGEEQGEAMWKRWGDPRDLPRRHPSVNYVFRRMGSLAMGPWAMRWMAPSSRRSGLGCRSSC